MNEKHTTVEQSGPKAATLTDPDRKLTEREMSVGRSIGQKQTSTSTYTSTFLN